MKNIILSTMLTTFLASTLCAESADNAASEFLAAQQLEKEAPTACTKTVYERVSGSVASVGRGLWKYRFELLGVAVVTMLAAQSYFAYTKLKETDAKLNNIERLVKETNDSTERVKEFLKEDIKHDMFLDGGFKRNVVSRLSGIEKFVQWLEQQIKEFEAAEKAKSSAQAILLTNSNEGQNPDMNPK